MEVATNSNEAICLYSIIVGGWLGWIRKYGGSKNHFYMFKAVVVDLIFTSLFSCE